MFFVVAIAVEGLGSGGGIIVVTKTENTAGGIGNVSDDARESFGDTHGGRPQ